MYYVGLKQNWGKKKPSSVHLLSGLDLLGPAALRPFLSDLGFFPGLPHKLLACTRESYIFSVTTHTMAINVLICIYFVIFIQREEIMSERGINIVQ